MTILDFLIVCKICTDGDLKMFVRATEHSRVKTEIMISKEDVDRPQKGGNLI